MALGLAIGLVVGFALGAFVLPLLRRSFTTVVVDLRETEPEADLPPIERRTRRGEEDEQPFQGRTWT